MTRLSAPIAFNGSFFLHCRHHSGYIAQQWVDVCPPFFSVPTHKIAHFGSSWWARCDHQSIILFQKCCFSSSLYLPSGAVLHVWIVVLRNRRAVFNLTDGDVIIHVHLDTLDFLDHTSKSAAGWLGQSERTAHPTRAGLGISPDDASVCQLWKAYSW